VCQKVPFCPRLPRPKNLDSDEKDALFGLGTQITVIDDLHIINHQTGIIDRFFFIRNVYKSPKRDITTSNFFLFVHFCITFNFG
jgi:hypothetical protein